MNYISLLTEVVWLYPAAFYLTFEIAAVLKWHQQLWELA